nr:hypothetical protein [uncultured Mediterranean phage uvMED]|tara:strand:- start:543 stop:680 length:138 start_codon:yes stop_codon:yes gene_type:complete
MQNILMLFAASGVFYISLSSTLHDLVIYDCQQNVENACSYLESKK